MFRKHARRVKSFSCIDYLRQSRKATKGAVYHLSLDAMKTVAKFICTPNASGIPVTLFPRLEELCDKILNEESTHWHKSFTTSLCGSTLRLLAFVFGRTPHHEPWAAEVYTPLEESLPRLGLIYPHLRFLRLADNYPFIDTAHVEDHCESIIQTLKDLRQLRSFSADLSLHFSLIETLAELPLLQTLELRGEREIASSAGTELDLALHHGFPSLTSLILEVHTPNSPINLLLALQASETLTSIHLEHIYTSFTCDSDPIIVFEAICRIPRLEILDVLLVDCQVGGPRPLPSLSGKLLATFFKLRHMKEIRLEGFSDITLTDTDLADAASAWPSLEDICFDPGDHSFVDDTDPSINSTPSAITLCGIQILYNNCPNIRRISLDINDSLPVVKGSLKLPLARPRDKAVGQLIIRSNSRLDLSKEYYADVIPIAIRLLFPQLYNLTIGPLATDSEPEKGWQQGAQANWEYHYRHMGSTQVQQSLHRVLAEMASENLPLGINGGDSTLTVVA